MRGDRLSTSAHEVERVLYDSSSSWEGIDAQEVPLGIGEVVLHIQPGFAAAMPLRFETKAVEEQLNEVVQRVEHMVPWCLWVIGPSSRPADLEQRLAARGFAVRIEWEGLVLEDLTIPIPLTPDLVIEPLSWGNAQAYASALAGGIDTLHHAELLAQAHRFLGRSPQEVQIYLARIQGEVAGYAVLRLEANGVAYLRNALTVPAFRHRGVYLSLVKHRLTVAQAAGCTAAVLQAQTKTSAPILIKRGFKSVCRIMGLARKRSRSTGNR
jgi:N-acetylglutamate synthase-like GNAT family acetyltransferase